MLCSVAGMRCGLSLTVELRRLIRRMLRAALAALFVVGCGRTEPVVIAVIPRTSGTMLWEPEHRGALAAASMLGVRIYWNASAREDDIDGQIALVERVTAEHYGGLVLAPDHSLALITPVRRALAKGLPTVIVGSPLPIPPDQNLFYILNDEGEGGRLAGQRVADLLHGRGSIAITGINPDIIGITARAASLETFLATKYPQVHIDERRVGSFNVAHEQQVAGEVLKASPGLDAIVALTSTSTHGAISAIGSSPRRHRIEVIGFDQDSLQFEIPALDAVVLQDTEGMGERAIRSIYDRVHGRPVPARIDLKPVLVTRENVNSPRIQEMTSMNWRPGSLRLQWRGAR